MKKMLLLCLLGLSGCGYEARDSEFVGQVKKTLKNTPIICPDYYDADISLGFMKGGVGSVSTQDIWVTVPDKDVYEKLKEAQEKNLIVRLRYDVKRVAFCTDDHIVTDFKVEE